ncbi:hypothetical protein AB0M02_26990 [Actinoplanes sp. NPDC051861]|uniref:hypothetical protein n=1 Tax=Actinoplanes sp. NPDC051861 TaxID=3155170 RepID=UPI00342BEE98
MFYLRVFFRTLLGGPLPEQPEFDEERIFWDHDLRDARDRARHGDWQAARKVIEQAGNDWELRGGRMGVLGDLATTEDAWLYAWLRAEPNDASAVLLQSTMLGQRAGEARGSAPAARTSAEQFQDFHQLMEASAQVGHRAMQLAAPNDPLPWVELLGTMFADRKAVQNSFDAVFNEGRRRDPFNFDLHLTALSLKCEKWYGSHEEMFAIARGVAAAAPSGASAVVLPLFAHFEFAMRQFGWDTRTRKSLRACRKYFRRPEVQHELDQWIAKWRAAPPNRARLATCRQWIALYYVLAGKRQEAKAVFDELGQYVMPTTGWAYFWGGGEYGYLMAWWWANGVKTM